MYHDDTYMYPTFLVGPRPGYYNAVLNNLKFYQ